MIYNIFDSYPQLIQRKPANRLGFNGPGEVKTHPWFKGFNWQKMYRKEMESPFIPSVTIEDHFLRKINSVFFLSKNKTTLIQGRST